MSLTGIPDAGRWSCLDDHPLQDAGVFPTGGDQVTVIVQEGNVGHMAAVTAVLVARSLRERVKKKLEKHEIISLLDFGKRQSCQSDFQITTDTVKLFVV